MEIRVRTTISLPAYLLGRLREEAKRRKKSLSKVVEEKLVDNVEIELEPNAETVAAIEESCKGVYAGVVDLSTHENFLKSLGI